MPSISRPPMPSLFLLLLMLACLSGCATAPPSFPTTIEDPAAPASAEASYWWYIRFRMQWPDGEEPPWYPDLFIADRIIRPILDEGQGEITLWRFHRRAARDAAGRQFSFIFHAPPAIARRVNARIAADPRLARWQQQEIVREVVYDDPSRPKRPDIADTSDPSWSPQMQRAWPYFIMGVSRLWLELIREHEQGSGLPRQPRARYAAISKTIDDRWRKEGAHALLHHLSALFGYRELEVTRVEVEAMRF